jgi:hypothetical protein
MASEADHNALIHRLIEIVNDHDLDALGEVARPRTGRAAPQMPRSMHTAVWMASRQASARDRFRRRSAWLLPVPSDSRRGGANSLDKDHLLRRF